jgi:spore germination protein YaaH
VKPLAFVAAALGSALLCLVAQGSMTQPAFSASSSCVAPTKLAFSRATGKLRGTLRWRPAGSLPAGGGYRVYRDGVVVGQTRATRFSVRVTPGKKVRFAVKVALPDGSVTACAGTLRTLLRWRPPTRPLDLSVVATGSGAVLRWRAARRGDGKLAGYRVFRDGVSVAQTRARSFSVQLASLRTYAFAVAAVDRQGKLSKRSNLVRVKTDHVGPSTPLGLIGEPDSDTAVTLRWQPVPVRAGTRVSYRVLRNGSTVAQTSEPVITLTRLFPATSYDFAVIAVDSLGYTSAPSSSRSVTTKAPEQATGGVHAFLLASTGASFADLQARYRQISTVYPTYFDCLPSGAFVGQDDPLVTRFAMLRGIRVMPRLNCQRTATLSIILNDPTVRQSTIDWIAENVAQNGYAGVNIDFEAGAASNRSAYTSFVRDLASRLHASGKSLSIAVSPKVRDQPAHPRSGIFDYPALAQLADTIFVMSWGIHWSTSGPGAIDDLPWATQVANYVAAQPNKERFVLGFGMYGMDWPNGGGPGNPATPLEHADVMQLAARYNAVPVMDPVSGAPHFSYTDASGVPHEVWYTDGASLGQRIALARARGLGIGFWRLGREDDAIWQQPLLQPGVRWP